MVEASTRAANANTAPIGTAHLAVFKPVVLCNEFTVGTPTVWTDQLRLGTLPSQEFAILGQRPRI
jgi:hypothetical protein